MTNVNMRIIYDNIVYNLQKSGGVSVYWAELSKRLNVSKKHDIVFYDQIENNHNLFRNSLILNNVKTESCLTLSIRRYLNFTPKINERSIFHSSYYRVSKSKNAINVTTIHDLTTEKFRKGLARWVNFQQKKHAVLNSDGVICISENTKKDLLELIPQIDESKIRVIYNGVSDDFFVIEEDFSIQDKEKRFKSLENQKYLLYVGHRTESYKNFNVAVKAASLVKEKYKLVIVGEALSDEEKKFVEKEIGNRYLIISKLKNKELNYLYNKAFALLYPSLYEGFGIPIVEAMKTKCPVIAVNSSSIPEVAGDGAILIDNINPLAIFESLKRLENSEFRNQLAERGLKQSEKFNWDNTFNLYIDYYTYLYNKK